MKVMSVSGWRAVLYIPKEVQADDVYVNPWKDEVEFHDRETEKTWYRDLEGYVQKKIWEIGDKDPLFAHVLEMMYIELRAMKDRLIELEERLEERDGRGEYRN